MNIAWWVQRWSELHPDKPAILFENQQINYRSLHRRAERTGCWLQDIGIEKGDRVAVMLKNCPEFVELYLATSRLGVIFVPINFRLAGAELDFVLKNSRSRLFVFDAEYGTVVKSLKLFKTGPSMMLCRVGDGSGSGEFIDYRTETAVFEGKKPFITTYMGSDDSAEPQVIMYTSGTTGQPKGAVLSHRKTFFNCLNAEIFFKLNIDDVMLIILPLFHSGGLFIQASPALYKGATLVIHPKFNPEKTYLDIERFKVTKLLGVPTVYRSLLNIEPGARGDLSSLQVCAIGGEKTTPQLLATCKEAGFSLRQVMGQTETSILLWASEGDSIKKPGTVGRPVFHAEVGVVDNDGRPVAVGEVGEIVVRGSIMMKEYWMDPDRTGETLRNGWLHTGDLARVDGDGYFYLVDRLCDMYISGGENVYPAEVERVLRDCPGVAEVAVVGILNERWGEAGHAYVVRKPGSGLTRSQLLRFCEGRLAAYKHPKKISFCHDFPRTALGKIRKRMIQSNPIGGAASDMIPDEYGKESKGAGTWMSSNN